MPHGHCTATNIFLSIIHEGIKEIATNYNAALVVVGFLGVLFYLCCIAIYSSQINQEKMISGQALVSVESFDSPVRTDFDPPFSSFDAMDNT